jgi:hypothetical protein
MSCAESTLEIEVMWEYNLLTCVAAFRVVEWEVKNKFYQTFNFDGFRYNYFFPSTKTHDKQYVVYPTSHLIQIDTCFERIIYISFMEDNHRDSNVIIRSRKTKKDRQYNDLKKKDHGHT